MDTRTAAHKTSDLQLQKLQAGLVRTVDAQGRVFWVSTTAWKP